MPEQLNLQQALRYSRQISLPKFDLQGQERLLASRVLLIGVGGLGCACGQYLVASGIGTLTLVDDDNIDLSNLQRQVLYSEQDIGQPKASTAVSRLQQLDSAVSLNAIDQRLDEQQLCEQVGKHDLVIDCTDNLATRRLLNRVCREYKRILVSGAAIRLEGQIACFSPGADQPCYDCLSHYFGEQQLSCSESGVLSPLVGVIGAIQALQAVKYLSGLAPLDTGFLHLLDGLTLEWKSINIPKLPQCPTCSEQQ